MLDLGLKVQGYVSSRIFYYAGRLSQAEFNGMVRGIKPPINVNSKYFLQIKGEETVVVIGGDLWSKIQERGGEYKHIEIEGPVEVYGGK